DEHSNSPLNQAIASFTDADGGVAADFVQKLQDLTAKNSEHELSIENYLIKSEEAFFGKVRKDKLSSATSVRSHLRDSVWGTPDPSIYSCPQSNSSPNPNGHPANPNPAIKALFAWRTQIYNENHSLALWLPSGILNNDLITCCHPWVRISEFEQLENILADQ
ncbi:hypothetical protein BT96DRAFT_289312, partial [Gymnopus androsaceus JB14]